MDSGPAGAGRCGSDGQNSRPARPLVMRRGPTEVHLPPGCGTKISHDFVAVTLHRHIGQGVGAEALIDLQPVDHKVVLLSARSLGQHHGAVTLWQAPQKCSYVRQVV